MRAGLFAPDRHSGILAHHRFATLAEAVRFVVEELSPAHQVRAFIDVGDDTVSIEGIRNLYDDSLILCGIVGRTGSFPALLESGPADLKFLQRLPQTRVGTSNRKRH
jgi:hypothetical protein